MIDGLVCIFNTGPVCIYCEAIIWTVVGIQVESFTEIHAIIGTALISTEDHISITRIPAGEYIAFSFYCKDTGKIINSIGIEVGEACLNNFMNISLNIDIDQFAAIGVETDTVSKPGRIPHSMQSHVRERCWYPHKLLMTIIISPPGIALYSITIPIINKVFNYLGRGPTGENEIFFGWCTHVKLIVLGRITGDTNEACLIAGHFAAL